jgi:hypothetical protein
MDYLPQGGESSPRGGWGICAPALPEVLTYLDMLNDNMVGYANVLSREMLDHLFETYGNITAVDLEINFEHMRRAWDPQQPVETLFKQIQDCADYSEAGGCPHW